MRHFERRGSNVARSPWLENSTWHCSRGTWESTAASSPGPSFGVHLYASVPTPSTTPRLHRKRTGPFMSAMGSSTPHENSGSRAVGPGGKRGVFTVDLERASRTCRGGHQVTTSFVALAHAVHLVQCIVEERTRMVPNFCLDSDWCVVDWASGSASTHSLVVHTVGPPFGRAGRLPLGTDVSMALPRPSCSDRRSPTSEASFMKIDTRLTESGIRRPYVHKEQHPQGTKFLDLATSQT